MEENSRKTEIHPLSKKERPAWICPEFLQKLLLKKWLYYRTLVGRKTKKTIDNRMIYIVHNFLLKTS
jgi:hypothetical protein